jgi:hypothetical protein
VVAIEVEASGTHVEVPDAFPSDVACRLERPAIARGRIGGETRHVARA